MNTIYSITYNRTHNPNCTAYRNANRNIATRIVKGETALHSALAEISEKGLSVVAVHDYVGNKVNI